MTETAWWVAAGCLVVGLLIGLAAQASLDAGRHRAFTDGLRAGVSGVETKHNPYGGSARMYWLDGYMWGVTCAAVAVRRAGQGDAEGGDDGP